MKTRAAILMLLLAAGGCKQVPVTPVTPEAYKQQSANVRALWKSRKLTTTQANDQLWALDKGAQDYCEDHYCGGSLSR